MSGLTLDLLIASLSRSLRFPGHPSIRGAVAGLLSLFLLAAGVSAVAQDAGTRYVRRPLKAVRLPENSPPPRIDGDISDPVWQQAATTCAWARTMRSALTLTPRVFRSSMPG
jgi:hypothetical protein